MDNSDRVLARLPRGELERRWKMVRDHMRNRNIEALIFQANGDTILGGPVRWITGFPVGAYMQVVVFPVDDLMTLIQHGGIGERRRHRGDEPDHPGVGEVINTATFFSAQFTHDYEARILLQEVRRRGWQRIGLVRAGQWPHAFASSFMQGISGHAELTDETEFIERCKAIKSPEERAMLRKTCAMQDEVFDRVIHQIKPGMRDVEIASLARHEGNRIGSDGEGVFLAASARIGEPAFHGPHHFQGRTISNGDQLSILIENNSDDGYYAEISRNIVFGKASAELLEGFEIAKAAQENTLRYLKPGASCKEIYTAHSEFLKAKHLPPELRLYCHGQGYDLVERPLIRDDETMMLERHMFLACHPPYVSATAVAVMCDNYFVDENGVSECVHRTPKKIFEL